MQGPAILILMTGGMLAPLCARPQGEAVVRFAPATGLVAQKDSTAKVALGVRVQNRAAFRRVEENGSGEDVVDFRVRRLRLKVEGFLLARRLEYKVQLGFSKQDLDLGDGSSVAAPLLDAIVLYRLLPGTKVGLGQMRMPGGRLMINSDATWKTPDRSVAVNGASLDRDVGVHLFQDLALGSQRMHVRAAVTQGEGRAPGAGDNGLCYTGRLDWLPLGPFQGNGEFSEGDLRYEESLKLAVAVAYSTDRRASRTRAQRGLPLPMGQQRTINTFFADMHLKYRGWGWQNEFNRRLADGSPLVLDPTGLVLAGVNEGWGFTSQLGRMLGERSQVVAMAAMVRHDPDVGRLYPDWDEALLGYNRFLRGHAVKLQGAVGRSWTKGNALNGPALGQWTAVIQLQWGIG